MIGETPDTDYTYYRNYEPEKEKADQIIRLFQSKFNQNQPFGKLIYDAALTGKIIVYDPFLVEFSGYKMLFPAVLTPTDVKNWFNSTDSVQIADPENSYDLKLTVYKREFNPSDVVAIDFAEQWTINTKTFSLKKKIIAIAPVLAVYGSDRSDYRGLLRMFWIKM